MEKIQYTFSIRETEKHDAEIATIEAESLEESERIFAELYPEDVENVEYITTEAGGYEKFF